MPGEDINPATDVAGSPGKRVNEIISMSSTATVPETPGIPAPSTTTPPPAGTPSLAAASVADGFLAERRTLALFVISVVGLFLELLLIRWISTEIRIFAYLQNTVLVVCFLGLGMGCWDSKRPFALRDVLLPLTGLVVLLSVPYTRSALGMVTELLAGFGDLVIWAGRTKSGWEVLGRSAIGLLLTLLIMALIWDTFVPFGRLLG